MPTPNEKHTDFTRLLEMIDDQVIDEWYKEVAGHDAHRLIDVDETMTAVELQHVTAALTDYHSKALNSGDVAEAVVAYRLLLRFAEHDDGLADQVLDQLSMIHASGQVAFLSPFGMLGGDQMGGGMG